MHGWYIIDALKIVAILHYYVLFYRIFEWQNVESRRSAKESDLTTKLECILHYYVLFIVYLKDRMLSHIGV